MFFILLASGANILKLNFLKLENEVLNNQFQ